MPPSNVTTRPSPTVVSKDAQFTVVHAGPSEDAATGDVRGRITDQHDQPAAGATVVATSELLTDEQVVIADDNGRWYFTKLRPGKYTLVFYYDNGVFSGNVHVRADSVARVTLDRWKPKPVGEVEVRIKE